MLSTTFEILSAITDLKTIPCVMRYIAFFLLDNEIFSAGFLSCGSKDEALSIVSPLIYE